MAPGSAMPRRTRQVLLAVAALAVAMALVAVRTAPVLARPAELQSELAAGPVATVHQSEENIIGSLGVEPASERATDGGLLARPDLVADGETAVSEPANAEQEAAADAAEYSDAGEEREGVVPRKAASDGGRVNFNKAASAADDLDHYFDNLPVHDVTPDHLPKGSREVVTRGGERALPGARVGAAAAAAEARFNNEPNSGAEWEDKMNNLEEAIHLFHTKGDAALEAAVNAGLTKEPYVPGERAAGPTLEERDLEQQGAIPSGLVGRMATSTGNKISGLDGLRVVQYKKLVDSIKGSISKEQQIMAKLRKDVAARKAEQGAAAGEGGKAAVAKYDDKKLDLNPPESSYYDEFSNFNPPISGEPQKTPYHGAEVAEPEQAADKASKPAQLGFIGGAGIEGGQGNADSIYGSHDDHDTYGVLGSGWQGPGNGEAPGDLWNPAKGERYKGVGASSGVKGAVAAGKMAPAAPEKSLMDMSKRFSGSVQAIAGNMKEERRELEEVQAAMRKTESVIDDTLHAGQAAEDKARAEWTAKHAQLSEARRVFHDLQAQKGGKKPAAAAKAGGQAKKSVKQQQLTRIDKIDEPSADLNPYWSPGWIYDEYSNYNPPKSGAPEMVKAGALNSRVGFNTWKGATGSESPPIHGGRYGDGNEMDATDMSAIFKGTKTAMLKGKVGKKGVKQQQLTRIDKIDEPSADLNPSWSPGWNYDEYSNYNPPKSGAPEMVKAGALNSRVGFNTWKGATGSESPPIHGGRYGDGNEMDATAMSAIFKTPKQAALAMKNDEIAMNIDQKQLQLGEGQLAAMAMHTLQHHKEELELAHAGQPEDPASVESWDKKDIARTAQQRKLVDDLSDAVQSEQLQLNAAEDAMVKMEMVSTASLAKEINARNGRSSSKAQRAHQESKAGGNAGKAAKASSGDELAAESAPPTPNKLAWVKKLGSTALKGLSDQRSKLPSKHEMTAAARRRRVVGSKQQQLALAVKDPAAAAKQVKKVATKAGGFGLCALFGMACS